MKGVQRGWPSYVKGVSVMNVREGFSKSEVGLGRDVTRC